MSRITIVPAPFESPLLQQVWELYRRNSGTLGFLPRGALDEFAGAGCVFAATYNDALLGYIAWRRSQREAVLVHLCVAEQHRGSGCARRLLQHMIDQCRDDFAIRLRCRKDYSANRLWPHFHFASVREMTGRGTDQMPLLVWRRVNRQAQQMDLFNDTEPLASNLIAIDANVFFDLRNPRAPNHDESSMLLADWLDDVDVRITRELRNEVARQPDDLVRKSSLKYLNTFHELTAHAEEIESGLAVLAMFLPPPVTESDHSDRRQLVYAWKGKANFFATRDEALLSHSGAVYEVTGMTILRPLDIVVRLHKSFRPSDYSPIRLQGLRINRRPIRTEEELLPFQRFGAGEPKSEWLRTIRAVVASSGHHTVEVVEIEGGPPLIAVALDRSCPRTLRLCFLRALNTPRTGTLLRNLLAELMLAAQSEGRTSVTILDEGPGEVQDALLACGFEGARDGVLVRFTLRGIVGREEAMQQIQSFLPDATVDAKEDAGALERRYWPLKIVDAGLRTYIVPIRRYWATQLFDKELARQELFGVPAGPALALENAYYSASKISIPPGSRILWYVSGDMGEVRAVSVCLETDVDTASRLSCRYGQLGVFKWSDVLSKASGDARARLKVYRFARTELLTKPVTFGRVAELISTHMGSKNQLQSPVHVAEEVFIHVYREGMEGPT